MQIAFFSNFLNHHQKLVADELARLTDNNFVFVELIRIPEWLENSGYPNVSYTSYVLRAWENAENYEAARILALQSDVALFCGHEAFKLETDRARNTDKLTFDVSERWLKFSYLNLFSKRLLLFLFNYYKYLKGKPVYKLCAGAYCYSDMQFFGAFGNKCFKWGYFTQSGSLPTAQKTDKEKLRIIWCARFIHFKHPELPIFMAHVLKKKGYQFCLDMFGSGPLFDRVLSLINKLEVNDIITLRGNIPNEMLLDEMRTHDVFLFTSDQREGWGTVANEAMSNGCMLVASEMIGAVPYLVKNQETGLTFTSPSIFSGMGLVRTTYDRVSLSSLCSKMEWVLNNRKEISKMTDLAYYRIQNLWGPQRAAANLMLLIEDLQCGKTSTVCDGPCSKA